MKSPAIWDSGMPRATPSVRAAATWVSRREMSPRRSPTPRWPSRSRSPAGIVPAMAADDAGLDVLADHHHHGVVAVVVAAGARVGLGDAVQVAAEHVHGRERDLVRAGRSRRQRVHHRLDARRRRVTCWSASACRFVVGVVVAAERDVHGHDRRDVGGEQRRRRQRLPLDVVGGDRAQRRRQLIGQLAHLRLATAPSRPGTPSARRCRPSWPARSACRASVPHGPQLDQRVVFAAGQQLLQLRRRDRRQRAPREADELAARCRRAPTAIGSACTVLKQGARCLAYADTSISLPAGLRPSASSPWADRRGPSTRVMWWKNAVRASVAALELPCWPDVDDGSAHGSAAP